MKTDQQTVLEQLWYTWSELGIDLIEAGFRIRAASEKLHDFRSERVQFLDRYERYSLPSGTESMTVKPEWAPVCLSLIRPEKTSNAVLVHKAYTGRDGFGRAGAFFIHLLDGLPADFSAHEAIRLWASDFWQRSDIRLRQVNPDGTLLPLVSLRELKDWSCGFGIQQQNALKLAEAYLPFLIQAFFEKKPPSQDKGPQNADSTAHPFFRIWTWIFRRPPHSDKDVYQAPPPEKICIAAADNDVVSLIFALTSCLPGSLARKLTFSTYERDIQGAPTEIVGTCWLGHTTDEAMGYPLAHNLIPAGLEREKLIVNCYTRTCSPLDQHPLLSRRPLAVLYAQIATKWFTIRYGPIYDVFVFLRKKDKEEVLQKYPVFQILLAFEKLFAIANNPEKQLSADEFLEYFQREIPSAQQLVLGIPSDYTYLSHESFWDEFFDEMIKTSSLSQMAEKLAIAIYRLAVENRYRYLPKRWLALLPPTQDNLSKIQLLLPSQSSDLDKFLNVFLVQYPETDLGLKDKLTWQSWIIIFFLKKSPLSRDFIMLLAEKYHERVTKFFQQLINQKEWPPVKGIFKQLAIENYQYKLEILQIILREIPVDDRCDVIRSANLTMGERASLLFSYGPSYLPVCEELCKLMLTILTALAEDDLGQASQERKKKQVLENWLNKLDSWFSEPTRNVGAERLEMLLQAAKLTPNEEDWFLTHYGRKYLKGNQVPATLRNLLSSRIEHWRVYVWTDSVWQADAVVLEETKQLLGILKEDPLSLEDNPEDKQVLDIFHNWHIQLTLVINHDLLWREPARVIPSIQYLLDYPERTPQTGSWIIETLAIGCLAAGDQLTYLLDQIILALSSQKDRILLLNTIVLRCLREYPLQKLKLVLPLLRYHELPSPGRYQIIKQLSLVCLADGNNIVNLLNQLSSEIPFRDFSCLLRRVAKNAGAGVREKRCNEEILDVCIQYTCTSNFKTIFANNGMNSDFFRRDFLDILQRYVDIDEQYRKGDLSTRLIASI